MMSDQSDFFVRIILTRFQGFLFCFLSLRPSEPVCKTVHSINIQASQAIQQVKQLHSTSKDGWQAAKVINQMAKNRSVKSFSAAATPILYVEMLAFAGALTFYCRHHAGRCVLSKRG
jgi:hypothetical protein